MSRLLDPALIHCLFDQAPDQAKVKTWVVETFAFLSSLAAGLKFEELADNAVYNSSGVPRLGLPPYNWWSEGLVCCFTNLNLSSLSSHV